MTVLITEVDRIDRGVYDKLKLVYRLQVQFVEVIVVELALLHQAASMRTIWQEGKLIDEMQGESLTTPLTLAAGSLIMKRGKVAEVLRKKKRRTIR